MRLLIRVSGSVEKGGTEMSDKMKDVNREERPPLRVQNVPDSVSRRHAQKLTEDAVKNSSAAAGNGKDEEQYSLNDDRRVKVLSPGRLVAKRFFRNRIAVVGLVILALMFLFSFVGGLISPYREDQLFYKTEYQRKLFAAVVENKELRYAQAPGQDFGSVLQAQCVLAISKNQDSFTYRNITYGIEKIGEGFYSISLNGTNIGFATMEILSPANEGDTLTYDFRYAAVSAYIGGETSFEVEGEKYIIDEAGGISKGGNEYAYVSRYIVQAVMPDVFLSRDFKEQLIIALDSGDQEFVYTGEDGVASDYTISFVAKNGSWEVLQATPTRVFDTYSRPSSAHWLGTDRNGMDMMTRLMYGGRVSLLVGFIVEFIATVLGVLFGGISGYFGKWVDNLIMRVVDIFYCIPSTPIIIILGAAMDATGVDPTLRMVYLMLILGFLSWPSVARLVRGQILSLREQEFMTATEATGLSVHRRIFKHLVPNVIPQLIVSCTMGLGSTIITEATLSFLGLGVKFPFASWGNIINDVNNTFVLTNYLFIWIPAGVCLLVTVLAFNLVGDGLRDAFDPRMKR